MCPRFALQGVSPPSPVSPGEKFGICSVASNMAGHDVTVREYTHCNLCRTQWENDLPPTPDSPTPMLVDISRPSPGLIDRTKNLINAIVDYTAIGFSDVDSHTQNKRMTICAGDVDKGIPRCARFDPNGNMCKECGCFLEVKTWQASAYCPLGFWGPLSADGDCGCGG